MQLNLFAVSAFVTLAIGLGRLLVLCALPARATDEAFRSGKAKSLKPLAY